jgi:hypothetical protein
MAGCLAAAQNVASNQGVTGMSVDDLDYYKARAEQELERAQGATCPEAVRAHYELAGLYLDRVYGSGADEPAHPGRGQPGSID